MVNDNIISIDALEATLNASMTRNATDFSKVIAAREVVDAALLDGKAHYALNTGFGVLAGTRIEDAQLKKLQRNLLISHSLGVAPPDPNFMTQFRGPCERANA